MKIMKSSVIKKLIIILVLISILCSLSPKTVNADLGGVLAKPVFSLVANTLANINVIIAAILKDGFRTVGNTNNLENETEQMFIDPNDVFGGNIGILNANIFSGLNTSKMPDATNNIVKVVAGMYYVIRNICGLVMLAGLIYTGIRILLSANIPTKKTQYLILLQDWLMGMALLVLSHVLMTGIFYFSDTLTTALSGTFTSSGNLAYDSYKNIKSWTNWNFTKMCTYTIILGYITWLVVVFAVAYFKRFFWVLIMVIFAPVFSVMYAFGSQTKQIYSRWIKEFITTVLVQPFHCLVYGVLIGLPADLTKEVEDMSFLNLMYILMAFSMIRPAEKWLRGMFGMDKGIANMASYDSGKKSIVEPAKKIAKTAATVAAVVGTGGAALGAVKAVGRCYG